MSLDANLDSWPKTRQPLPDDYQRVYEQHMHVNRSGGTRLNRAALWLEQWMHRQVARPPGLRILELGAGGLNHLDFETPEAEYAVVEPLSAVVMGAMASQARQVDYVGDYQDLLREAASSPGRYDKIISIAVLEHLEDLPAVVAASALLLAPGGVFAAGIPSEGGLLWQAGWRTTTARAFRRDYGLDYAQLMRWEHINTAREIEAVVRTLFENVRVKRFPGPTIQSSLYSALFATRPRRSAAAELITSRLRATQHE